MTGHTPGPWRWEINEQCKQVHLVGGRPRYDLTILEPIRWGMSNATFQIRDTAFDGMNLMHKLHERRDWIVPFPGRDHHKHWCANVAHPDMRLIAAAPEQHAELLACKQFLEDMHTHPAEWVVTESQKRHAAVCAAIAKATGAQS